MLTKSSFKIRRKNSEKGLGKRELMLLAGVPKSHAGASLRPDFHRPLARFSLAFGIRV